MLHGNHSPPSREETPEAYKKWRAKASLREYGAAKEKWWSPNKVWAIPLGIFWFIGLVRLSYTDASWLFIIGYLFLGAFICIRADKARRKYAREALDDFYNRYPELSETEFENREGTSGSNGSKGEVVASTLDSGLAERERGSGERIKRKEPIWIKDELLIGKVEAAEKGLVCIDKQIKASGVSDRMEITRLMRTPYAMGYICGMTDALATLETGSRKVQSPLDTQLRFLLNNLMFVSCVDEAYDLCLSDVDENKSPMERTHCLVGKTQAKKEIEAYKEEGRFSCKIAHHLVDEFGSERYHFESPPPHIFSQLQGTLKR